MNQQSSAASGFSPAPTTCTVVLENPYSTWFSSKPTEARPIIQGRGYASVGDKYVEGQDLIDFVQSESRVGASRAQQVARVKELIRRLNGDWALVVRWPDGHLVASTDRLRSIPLFYASLPGEFIVASSVDTILSRCRSPEIDDDSALEFLMAGYVTGNETLWKGIYQMQPGQIIEYSSHDGKPQLSTIRYYRFLPSHYSADTESQLEEKLESVLDTVFHRLVRAMSGRKLVVPLSGGLDSRLVAAMLKRHGCNDVLCVTYGRKDHEEAIFAREVARVLGYEWRFFEYDGDLWARAIDSEAMLKYWEYSCNGVSLPHFRDLPAVSALVDAWGAARDTVFMPGLGGDFLGGGRLPWELVYVSEDAVDEPVVERAILQYHYRLWRTVEMEGFRAPHLKALVNKIKRLTTVGCHDGQERHSPIARYQMWEVEGRQAVLMVNSVRGYEFIGADWRIPIWDYEVMDFFQSLPLRFRIHKRVYINTAREKIFSGKASRLGEVPLTGIGWWDERVSAPSRRGLLTRSVKAATREALRRCGLLHTVREVRRRAGPGHPAAFDTWFAGGRDPRSLSVREALGPYRVLEELPSALVAVIEPSLEKRLDLAYSYGLLSAIVLARYYGSLGKRAGMPLSDGQSIGTRTGRSGS